MISRAELYLSSKRSALVHPAIMKVTVKHWHAVAHWKWDIGTEATNDDPDEEEDVCGICRVAFEGCCPTCKTPGDDCPLSTWLVPSF